MRYVTDDITEDFVALSNEIDCIRDYIDLQKLRLGRKMIVDFECSGEFENKKLPPLILMTFIENIFKYGVSNHESSDISIKIYADSKSITFFSMNRVFGSRAVKRNGIGIANVRKRLEHLYGDKHFLNIVEEHGNYIVQLTLQSLS
jgi:LytS/YehU family sensor histidine kinase